MVILLLALVALGLLGTGAATATASETIYAYPGGSGTSGCTATTADCSLAHALEQASTDASSHLVTIMLEPNASGTGPSVFYGNWTISGATSNAITVNGNGLALDGDQGATTGTCETTSCTGPVLTIGDGGSYTLVDLTIDDADNTTADEDGGALLNEDGATVTISGDTFQGDHAYYDGGAIDNGENSGASGTLKVTDSTFSDDQSDNGDGGAIDNGDYSGSGTLTVTDSSFSGDTAGASGGAIDNAANGATGTLSVTGTSFSDDSAPSGGAINNGYSESGSAVATVSDSVFSGDGASGSAGGAILNSGIGVLTVSNSTFDDDTAAGPGGAIANAWNGGTSQLSVWGSTFTADSSTASEGADVSNGYNGGTGEAWLAADILSSGCKLYGGTWSDQGDNVADASCLRSGSGDVTASGAAAGLATAGLKNNGGPVATIALTPSSPAAGAVASGQHVTLGPATDGGSDQSVSLCGSGSEDARGDARPGNGSGRCDAGAFELEGQTSSSLSCPSASVISGQGVLWCTLSVKVAGVDQLLTAGVSLAGSATIALYPDAADCNTRVDTTASRSVSVSATGQATLGAVSVQGGGYWVGGSYGAQSGSGFGFQSSLTASCVKLEVTAEKPKITAKLSSKRPKTRFGWHGAAVMVHFSCSAPSGTTLSGPCPATVVLSKSAAGQSLTRSVSTVIGTKASLTVSGVNIDTHAPYVRILGPRRNRTYGRAPRARCRAREKLSGIASCKLTRHRKRDGRFYRYTLTATATTRAGISRTVRVRFRVRRR